MSRMMKVKASLVACLAMVLMTACKGEVTKKYGCDGTDDKDKPCQMLVVERDGNGKVTKERKVNVTQEVFDTCAIGQWYENDICRNVDVPHMEEIPAEDVNEPNRRPDRDRQNQQERREVCIEVISSPRVKLNYDFYIPPYRETETATVGDSLKRCRTAHVDDIVFATVEHIDSPSTVMCLIWVYKKGVKVTLDFKMTQDFGDCKVQAQVPPV